MNQAVGSSPSTQEKVSSKDIAINGSILTQDRIVKYLGLKNPKDIAESFVNKMGVILEPFSSSPPPFLSRRLPPLPIDFANAKEGNLLTIDGEKKHDLAEEALRIMLGVSSEENIREELEKKEIIKNNETENEKYNNLLKFIRMRYMLNLTGLVDLKELQKEDQIAQIVNSLPSEKYLISTVDKEKIDPEKWYVSAAYEKILKELPEFIPGSGLYLNLNRDGNINFTITSHSEENYKTIVDNLSHKKEITFRNIPQKKYREIAEIAALRAWKKVKISEPGPRRFKQNQSGDPLVWEAKNPKEPVETVLSKCMPDLPGDYVGWLNNINEVYKNASRKHKWFLRPPEFFNKLIKKVVGTDSARLQEFIEDVFNKEKFKEGDKYNNKLHGQMLRSVYMSMDDEQKQEFVKHMVNVGSEVQDSIFESAVSLKNVSMFSNLHRQIDDCIKKPEAGKKEDYEELQKRLMRIFEREDAIKQIVAGEIKPKDFVDVLELFKEEPKNIEMLVKEMAAKDSNKLVDIALVLHQENEGYGELRDEFYKDLNDSQIEVLKGALEADKESVEKTIKRFSKAEDQHKEYIEMEDLSAEGDAESAQPDYEESSSRSSINLLSKARELMPSLLRKKWEDSRVKTAEKQFDRATERKNLIEKAQRKIEGVEEARKREQQIDSLEHPN